MFLRNISMSYPPGKQQTICPFNMLNAFILRTYRPARFDSDFLIPPFDVFMNYSTYLRCEMRNAKVILSVNLHLPIIFYF